MRAAYPAMELVARSVIVPLAFASLLTGVIQSLGTRWGLFRHYWVLAKLLLTLFATTVLLIKIELISYASKLSMEAILPHAELSAVGTELAVQAAGGLLVLLAPVALSVYKPQGLTPYGRRMQDERVSPSQGGLIHSRRSDHNDDAGIRLSARSVVLTVPRMYLLGSIVIVLVLHLVILHLTSSGLGGH